jgi:hypothetical protein
MPCIAQKQNPHIPWPVSYTALRSVYALLATFVRCTKWRWLWLGLLFVLHFRTAFESTTGIGISERHCTSNSKKHYSPGSLGFYAPKRASISDDFVSVSIRSRLVRQFLAGSLRVRPQCHFAWIPVCSPTRRGAVGVTQRLPDTKYGQYVQGTRGVAGTNKHRMCLYLIANLLAVGSEASIPL